MNLLADEHNGADVLYLSRQEVVSCCAGIDVVGVVAEALKSHAKDETVIPEEAYLGWQTPDGFSARCLAMPGAILRERGPMLGLKVINASLGNIARGLPRSQGFTMIFDAETSRPQVIMEAAYVSALRTAAVTAVAAQALATTAADTVALIGCGTLAKAHMVLLPSVLPSLRRVVVHDLDPARSDEFAAVLRAHPGTAHLDISVAPTARACVADADIIVPVTTVTEGYIPFGWLKPGALVAHVSLDDLLPEVIERSALVLVDDWGLVSHDPRRLLGRMYRAGTLVGPDGGHFPGAAPAADARKVDGTLGEVLLGVRPGRSADSDVIVTNPFGMSILDVAVGSAVLAAAVERGAGVRLPL